MWKISSYQIFSVKIIDDFYIILGKFKSILIDVNLNLTNINLVLKDFNIKIFTKKYSRFQVNVKNFNKLLMIPL
jgi:hypothetical protein